MIVAQPTWGVDVGASAFLRQRLLDLAAEGVAILLISEWKKFSKSPIALPSSHTWSRIADLPD